MKTTRAPASYLVRSITPADRIELARFYAGLSADSASARFHGAAPGIAVRTAQSFCGPDHQHREGIVAETFDPRGRPVLIGHLCIEPTSSDEAEMAIVVSDTWQRRGVGRAMLGEAFEWAQAHGIDRLVASMRSGNTAMIGLIRSLGYPVTLGIADCGVDDVLVDVRRPMPNAA